MATQQNPNQETFFGRLLQAMVNRVGRVILALIVVSAVLFLAGNALSSDEDASFNPSGEEFDTEKLVDLTFRPSTTELPFIIEDEDADALDAATLREWR